ncbi:Ubiquitin system component Cue [Penicillium argentinense]|uniref:RNA polymerase II degradation factor 1 n=1 Tax=Penicillium argentinense TaxID=1131581 RepID=A0A9W9KFV6_9EURO|nr:Ubiquitin system component Cue [Penicillium argentinense]KAJ5103622.1 Ubiquitin system component Cue [Penicillium argentinense]
MVEVQNRSSARGRVSARGGRGGFSSRGGRGGSSRSANADNSDAPSFEEGEIGQMKKKYSDTLPTLKELFSEWKDEDLIFALEDSNGELEEAIMRISEGESRTFSENMRLSQADVEVLTDIYYSCSGNVSQWGEVKKTTDRTRPKAKEVQSIQTEPTTVSTRGSSRGRGAFEGRGRARGDRGRGGRGGRAGAQTANGTRTASSVAEPAATNAATEPVTTKVGGETEQPAAGETTESAEAKTSMIPEGTKKGWASLFAKPAPPPPQKKPPMAAPAAAPAPAPEKPAEQPAVEEKKAPEPAPVPAASQKTPVAKPVQPAVPAIPTTTVKTPAGDLTETNLERIPDVSAPAPTATAASTVGSALDPAAAANVTPSRVPQSGLPGSALKQGRTPGFQRRVMEQQQAVVMPGNHAVDRAAVQFGSMGLNGDAVDIDENREEAETRAQPPQHSPVAPRASLPPPSQAPAETTAAARPAPGLPPVPQASASESFGDFSRFTDPFSQPQPQIQEPFANQAPAQPAAVTTSGDYSSFYAADQRFPYYNQYAGYGQTQDAGARAAAGFGVSAAEAQPQIPTTQPPGRYGPVDATNSGHNTPNPTLPAATQTPAVQQMPGQAAHGYGYSYPYYNNNPHYASYMNQMNQHQQYGRNRPMYDDARRYDEQHYGMPHNSQYGYGSQYGPYGGKGGMYGQPHTFSYDHSSSPANAGSFNQGMPGRDSVYGRTGSAQPSDNQQSAAGTNAFGSGMSDVFAQSQTGFGRNPPVAQQPPPLLAQANRPGSATNSVPGQPQAQTGLPPLQGQQGQQGFGAYPNLNPQYGGLGGLGGHQAAASQTHQATGYGNYGAGFGNYYGNTGRGGWGGNYGH